MKIVYMGTPDFAVPPLAALVQNGYEVTAVVTQPDKPKLQRQQKKQRQRLLRKLQRRLRLQQLRKLQKQLPIIQILLLKLQMETRSILIMQEKIDGVAFDGGSTDGKGTDLVIGSGTYIDNFEEQLIGAHPGDEVEVKVTFPDDYQATDLAGKEAVFDVTVNGIYE